MPHDEAYPDGSTRLEVVLGRISAMSDGDVAVTLDHTRQLFAERHRGLDAVFIRSFDHVAPRLEGLGLVSGALSSDRRHLIGAYFTHEFSIEAAALANPSVVAAPDQSGLAAGDLRFVMSLRAIGEGHLSSIEFRTGVVRADASVHLDAPSGYARTGEVQPDEHHRRAFAAKLDDFAMANDVERHVLSRLPDRFTTAELDAAIRALDGHGFSPSMSGETTRFMQWLASSSYRTTFPVRTDLSERVLHPSSPIESRGMEDARFVRFVDDDGTVTYYATYTAFDGHQSLPQLLETTDFAEFRVSTLSGTAARNKGIALFPRRIDGEYVALGRHDSVSNFILRSNDIRIWHDATVIQEPEQPWELMQLGNCGSPLETDAGWLVITHGVGPMRRYSLGALLLDRHDPTRVIGHLRDPLLSPATDEREGYVPNVVYSCGSLIHGDHLVLPYGYADVGARLATIPLADLLDRLTAERPTRPARGPTGGAAGS